jgi:hypothetical protein
LEAAGISSDAGAWLSFYQIGLHSTVKIVQKQDGEFSY